MVCLQIFPQLTMKALPHPHLFTQLYRLLSTNRSPDGLVHVSICLFAAYFPPSGMKVMWELGYSL